jgi:hypothetical protein
MVMKCCGLAEIFDFPNGIEKWIVQKIGKVSLPRWQCSNEEIHGQNMPKKSTLIT